jgi:histidinol phosphatase-like enzyme
MKNYKVVFSSLDDTLVSTLSGNKIPDGVYDMQIKFTTFAKLKKLAPEFIVIVSNQGEIHKGKVDALSFISKLNYIKRCLVDYIGCQVFAEYCPTPYIEDKYRKPNLGMFERYAELFKHNDCSKGDFLMLGCNEDDKKTAENFGIDFINVLDFIK